MRLRRPEEPLRAPALLGARRWAARPFQPCAGRAANLFQANAEALERITRRGGLYLCPLNRTNEKDTMTTELLLNRLTDRLRNNIGATSTSELLDFLARLGLAAMRDAGFTELTGSTLTLARDLIDGLEEAIGSGERLELGHQWLIEVDVVAPAVGIDPPGELERPLVDDLVIWRATGILSEVHA